jgi:hypothetical protein
VGDDAGDILDRKEPQEMTRELSTRHIGWCPVCERDIKVRARLLVHHGYQRPGVGYIIGDCIGVGYEPYELGTGAAKAYLTIILERVGSLGNRLRVLESPKGPKSLSFEHYDVETRRRIRGPDGHPVIIQLTHDEADALQAQLPSYDTNRYSWERQLKIAIAQTRSELEFWTREQRRIDHLIAEWRPQPLRTFEEEIQRQEQTRAERETTRTAARDAKISAEVVKIRKRIDSAVKNKNSSVLADIFTSTKLRDLAGWISAERRYRIEQADALALLERDNVWRAFGLLTPGGYLDGPAAQALLEAMRWGPRVPTTTPGLRFEYGPIQWPPELGGGVAKTR